MTQASEILELALSVNSRAWLVYLLVGACSKVHYVWAEEGVGVPRKGGVDH